MMNIRPLNSGSLPTDIAHAIQLVKPTHIATTPTLLSKVRNGLLSIQNGSTSAYVLFTVTERAQELPLVGSCNVVSMYES
jgi:hypothetical protein